jgi:hypothetical protein
MGELRRGLRRQEIQPPGTSPPTCVTGAAHLAEEEVIPVFIVGIFRACATKCVLAVAAFS